MHGSSEANLTHKLTLRRSDFPLKFHSALPDQQYLAIFGYCKKKISYLLYYDFHWTTLNNCEIVVMERHFTFLQQLFSTYLLKTKYMSNVIIIWLALWHVFFFIYLAFWAGMTCVSFPLRMPALYSYIKFCSKPAEIVYNLW